MKKHLKTIEDIAALRDTDTKIYFEKCGGYVQFVNGQPCTFYPNGDASFGVALFLSDKPYIEVSDKQGESRMGKLGWFWENCEELKSIDVLGRIEAGRYWTKSFNWSYRNFRPLTPEEVEKHTGYKVVEED